MKTLRKAYLNLSEVASRWGCNFETVVYYIECDLLQLFARMYVIEYTSEKAIATIGLVSITDDFEQKLINIVHQQNLKLGGEDNWENGPVRVLYNQFIDLDQENKLIAKSNSYAKCFISVAEIERFEIENCIDEIPNQPHQKLTTESKNDHKLSIKYFIEKVIEDYPNATSKDIINHCFECYQGNNRKLGPIKRIIIDLGIKHGGSGKRSKDSIAYMQKAPKYKPTL